MKLPEHNLLGLILLDVVGYNTLQDSSGTTVKSEVAAVLQREGSTVPQLAAPAAPARSPRRLRLVFLVLAHTTWPAELIAALAPFPVLVHMDARAAPRLRRLAAAGWAVERDVLCPREITPKNGLILGRPPPAPVGEARPLYPRSLPPLSFGWRGVVRGN